jgi:hypothetical protein
VTRFTMIDDSIHSGSVREAHGFPVVSIREAVGFANRNHRLMDAMLSASRITTFHSDNFFGRDDEIGVFEKNLSST